MIKLIIFFVIGYIAFWCVKNHVNVDFVSFIKKGFSARRGKFGVYCFCGKQGSGKTFCTVNFLRKNCNMPIYSNIELEGIHYNHFDGFDELLKINDHHCIIVFDEIFTALTKNTRMSNDVLSFLSQMRKKEVIFITTAQEWLEINITLRRYVRYQIDCNIVNILPFSIMVETYHDGEQMRWSQEENDYIAPIVATKISKMEFATALMYDTNQVIGTTLKVDSKKALSDKTPSISNISQKTSLETQPTLALPDHKATSEPDHSTTPSLSSQSNLKRPLPKFFSRAKSTH